MRLFGLRYQDIVNMKLNVDVKGLIRVLNSGILRREKNVSLREEAVRALGEIKDPRAVKPLTRALKDKNPRIRKTAEKALKEIKSCGTH